jgi:hypothetical protein
MQVPTILREGPFRFYLTLGDCYEPPHVHIDADSGKREAKYWLDPVERAREEHFKDHELREIERIISKELELMLEKWKAQCPEAN